MVWARTQWPKRGIAHLPHNATHNQIQLPGLNAQSIRQKLPHGLTRCCSCTVVQANTSGTVFSDICGYFLFSADTISIGNKESMWVMKRYIDFRTFSCAFR